MTTCRERTPAFRHRAIPVLAVVIFIFAQVVPPGARAQSDPGATLIAAYCRSLALGNARPKALQSVCQFSLSVQPKLPNYICDEKLQRWSPDPGRLPEMVEAEVAFVDGRESYSNVRINGKSSPTMSSPGNVGISSAGEFGTQLRNLFAPENKAKFKFRKEVNLNAKPALLFAFEIMEGENRSFKVWTIDGTTTRPGYNGSMWVDKSTLRPLRMEMASRPLRSQTGVFHHVSFDTDYREVDLADGSTFLLPHKANVNACLSASMCFRNKLEFSNWRKFAAKSKIIVPE